MILADKIMMLRKKNGWSQEELASQLNVSRQSVSKWESAGSIPDLDKILQMSRIFGVTVDYLLKDEKDLEEYIPEEYSDDTIRKVSMDEAHRYMDTTEQAGKKISFGVSLCIISPIPLILFCGGVEDHLLNDGNFFVMLGLILMILMIVPAVALFITTGMKLSRFEYLQQEEFDTEYGVDDLVGERKHLHDPIFARNITLGVMMCILSVVPLLLLSATNAYFSNLPYIFCTSLMFLIIAGAVNLFIRTGLTHGCYNVLLQLGDYTREKKRAKKAANSISTIYWCIVTAGYLGYSLATMNWQISWIVWPVAGVLYGAILAIGEMFNAKK